MTDSNKKRFLNCTPHVINLRQANGLDVSFNPCGTIPRVVTSEKEVGFNCVPLVTSETGDVTNLPDFSEFSQEGTVHIFCIVSRMVLDAVKPVNGVTFVAPDSGKTAIRNEKGHIVAVTRLVVKEN
jgi:hypothetical protein